LLTTYPLVFRETTKFQRENFMARVSAKQQRDGLSSRLDLYLTSSSGTISAGFRQKLSAWPRYAAAVGSALALASSAEASIIYSGVENLSCFSTFEYPRISMAGNAFVLWVIHHWSTWGRWYRVGMYASLEGQILGTGGDLRKLASGANISGGVPGFGHPWRVRQRNTHGYTNKPQTVKYYGNWPAPSSTGFAGVKFTEGGQPHYGWVRLEYSAWPDGSPVSITAIDWAYNDVAGAPIRAGQTSDESGSSLVPEPSGKALALLAAGAMGVLAWRKRRRESL
jgi:hypothetical protein